ncbi:MAG TPA: chemotaxis protein CheW [Malonomonas sp.]
MTQLLPFKLGAETYALNLTEVQEVVERRAIYPLPGAPETIAGAISFHGRIVPVVDLPGLLGFSAGQRAERLLVLTDANGPLALTVDGLRTVINVDLVRGTLSRSESEADCISGVLSWQDEMISLLDLNQLQKLLEQLCSKTGG